MYSVFWENMFADSISTVYSFTFCNDLDSLKKEISRLNDFDKRYKPNIIMVFKEGVGRIDYRKEILE